MRILSIIRDKKWFLGALFIYGGIRVLSYVFPPGTLINTLLSTGIALAASYSIFKKKHLGWIIVAGEILLGGSGGFLAIGFVSLRTALVLLSSFSYAIIYRRELRILYTNEPHVFYILGFFLATAIGAAVHGLLNHHHLAYILGDTIPYFFVLYYFPARMLYNNEHFKKAGWQLLAAAIIGNMIFTYGTFIAFSTGSEILHDQYYRWFRDVAGGKITDLGFHFFRIVLNEQLLVAPVLVYLFGKKLFPDFRQTEKKPQHYSWHNTLFPLLAILAVNLTRIYYLALVAGMIGLASWRMARRWATYCVLTMIIVLGVFVTTHTIASRGASLGLELFGLRLQSITTPSIESSSLSRLLLLPAILQKIDQHTLLGAGLGDEVTVYSPVLKKRITTPQFDWGYLELHNEFGVILLSGWIVLCGALFYELRRRSAMTRSLAASLLTIAVINITSPAFFHALGVLYIILALAWCSELPNDEPLSSD